MIHPPPRLQIGIFVVSQPSECTHGVSFCSNCHIDKTFGSARLHFRKFGIELVAGTALDNDVTLCFAPYPTPAAIADMKWFMRVGDPPAYMVTHAPTVTIGLLFKGTIYTDAPMINGFRRIAMTRCTLEQAVWSLLARDKKLYARFVALNRE